MRIGLLSDTHGFLLPPLLEFFADCDELWHAGDIGIGVLEELQEFKPVEAVHGNMDTSDLMRLLPQTKLMERGGLKVIMTHIGGWPGHYNKNILPLLLNEKPDIFVTGHSHILRVMYDEGYKMLHINPGAAGSQGFHKVSTLVRFTIDGTVKGLEICEFDKW